VQCVARSAVMSQNAQQLTQYGSTPSFIYSHITRFILCNVWYIAVPLLHKYHVKYVKYSYKVQTYRSTVEYLTELTD